MRGAIFFILLLAVAQDASAYWWIDLPERIEVVDCD